jgi:hypothetical protein
MPPPTANLSDLKSIFLNLELVNNKLNNVLTAVIIVNRYFERSFTKLLRSLGLAISILLDPMLKKYMKLTENEKM